MNLRAVLLAVVFVPITATGIMLAIPADHGGSGAQASAVTETAAAEPAVGEGTLTVVGPASLTVTPATAQAGDASDPQSEPVETTVLWTTAQSLNMRSAPTTSAALVTSLPFGTAVEVQETNGRWALVTAPDGQQGWMSLNFLTDSRP